MINEPTLIRVVLSELQTPVAWRALALSSARFLRATVDRVGDLKVRKLRFFPLGATSAGSGRLGRGLAAVVKALGSPLPVFCVESKTLYELNHIHKCLSHQVSHI